jgi:CRP/FNR family transcriptional regulator, cyclic AMP receptor protein
LEVGAPSLFDLEEKRTVSFVQQRMTDPLFPRFGREFRAGEVLFREGESGEEMFVIQSGLVRISKQFAGEERPLATLGRGEFVGEMAILNEKPRTATATVVEDAKCLVIGAKTLEMMISNNAEIAFRLIKKLARRLDSADELVQILMNPDPEARVMLGLKRHAETFGEETPTGVNVHLSADELAREVGADIDHVYDVLRRLTRLHIASEVEEGGSIVVADVERLMEFLEFLDTPRVDGRKSEES